MSCRRFTDQELFSVRNHIPIRQVIEHLLGLRAKTEQGVFRFCCPLCDEYNTAINHKTNLARCFHCEKNFNPIDITMIVRQTDFVETINLLLNYKSISSPANKTSSKDNGLSKVGQPSSTRKSSNGLIPIGDILTELVEKIKNENVKAKNENKVLPKQPSADDISKLEQIVETLSQIIQELKSHQ